MAKRFRHTNKRNGVVKIFSKREHELLIKDDGYMLFHTVEEEGGEQIEAIEPPKPDQPKPQD